MFKSRYRYHTGNAPAYLSLLFRSDFSRHFSKQVRRAVFFFACICLIFPSTVFSYSGTLDTEDPPAGIDRISGQHGTSSPVGSDCSSCHGSGGGYTFTSTSVSGSTTVNHDSTNSYSIGISGSTAVRIGFNLAIYNASNTKQTGSNAPSNTDANATNINDEIAHTSPQLPSYTWSFDWTAPSTLGTYTFFYCINQVDFDGVGYDTNDGPPACSSQAVTVINDSPVAVDDNAATIPGGLNITESASTTFNAISGGPGSNDSDTENDDIDIVSINSGSTIGNVTLNNGETGSISYDTNNQFEYLAAGESTTDSFTYTIQDDYGASYQDTGTVTVTINGQNDAPVLGTEAESISVGEGNTTNQLTISGFGTQTNLLFNDSDVDTNDSLVISDTRTAAASDGGFGTVTINANGTFSYTHDGTENFTDSFTYRITDGTVIFSSKKQLTLALSQTMILRSLLTTLPQAPLM